LAKLQSKGLLKPLEDSSDAMGSGSPSRPLTPPIPSEHRVDAELVEKRQQPMTSLRDFSMRSLKVRYSSVINALQQHSSRQTSCPTCGLRFEALGGEIYQRHLDWHFRENIRTREGSYGQSRPWYLPMHDWIVHSEQAELIANANAAAQLAMSTTGNKVKSGGNAGVTGMDHVSSHVALEPVTGVATELAHSKECAVCGETFDEYWDEDDDVWKLKGCVVDGTKAYHPACLADDNHRLEENNSSRMETDDDQGLSMAGDDRMDVVNSTTADSIT